VSHPNAVFEAFGFSWNPAEIPFPALAAPDSRRAIWRAKKIFAEIIHDITVMEGNPFTVKIQRENDPLLRVRRGHRGDGFPLGVPNPQQVRVIFPNPHA
jgi:hypothetical protein